MALKAPLALPELQAPTVLKARKVFKASRALLELCWCSMEASSPGLLVHQLSSWSSRLAAPRAPQAAFA